METFVWSRKTYQLYTEESFCNHASAVASAGMKKAHR